MKENRSIFIILPLIIAAFMILGIFLGRELGKQQGRALLFKQTELSENDKLQQVLSFIRSDYVDTVKEEMILEETIQELLQNLDPHSYYIPGKQFAEMNDPLEGNFEGIGVEFRIVEDTVVIIQALGGGPSEKVGIMAGDRIIEVDGKPITGPKIGNRDVIKSLKGPKGTKVAVKVVRRSEADPIEFTIVRDKIPFHSIEAAYMIDDNTAYIKIARFARTTYDEFKVATSELRKLGMQDIVLDLRNNTGGLMKAAIDLADEFLKDGELIVYTKGKSRNRVDYFATSRGSLENTEVAILINEGSASASEILAGAIQDNDRGLIVGRRSFGKGLVQESVQWPDGSAIRLTVARYYTPTGRSIQKPYDEGTDKYNEEAYQRYINGELFSKDSIDFPDSLKYFTAEGKVVYGGGGITPDLFIGIDTNSYSDLYRRLNYQGTFYQFGFEYVDEHRETLASEYGEVDFASSFTIGESLMKEFYEYASDKGFDSLKEKLDKASLELAKNRIKGSIARNFAGDNAYYEILNKEDRMVQETLDRLNEKNPLMTQRVF
jgi:carboxyl-terminal processing protease